MKYGCNTCSAAQEVLVEGETRWECRHAGSRLIGRKQPGDFWCTLHPKHGKKKRAAP